MSLPKVYTREDFDRFRQKYFDLQRKFDRVECRITNKNELFSVYSGLQHVERIIMIDCGEEHISHDTMDRTETLLERAERVLAPYRDETKEDFEALKQLFVEQAARVETVKDATDEWKYNKSSRLLSRVSDGMQFIKESENLGEEPRYTHIITHALNDLVEIEKLIFQPNKKPVPAGV